MLKEREKYTGRKFPDMNMRCPLMGKSKGFLQLRPKELGITQEMKQQKKPSCNNKGYLVVDLYATNKRKTFLVHRLVAEAFVPNPHNFPCVNHKDENKRNNNADNLEWCTHEYNMAYGTRNKRIAEKNGKPIVQLDLCNNVLRRFASALEAQKATGISNANINECCHKKRKTAGGYIWQFET